MLTIGGISFEEDKKNYRDRSANILVSTVGRLLELFSHKIVKLSNNPVIIFDEGDKLFEISDSKFWKLLKFIPSSVRKLVFSATYSKKAL